jgi:hypothetical protein
MNHAQVKQNPEWPVFDANDAVDALKSGVVDAMVLVAGIQAPVVQRLLTGSFHLMNYSHAQAVARQLPAYSVVTLPRGAINQMQDKPSEPINLLATQAILTSTTELHPALTYLLLDAAQKIHGGSGLLHEPNQFPSAKVAEFTVADETTRYYKDGKPWLEKVLPFWLANFIARLLLVLIPVMAILFPIIKLLPEAEAYLAKMRLQPHYKKLHILERDFFALPAAGHAKKQFPA